MPSSLPDPSVPCSKREAMARPPEVVNRTAGRSQCPTSQGPIVGRDTGRHACMCSVHGDRVGCTIDLGIVDHHLRESKMSRHGGRDGTADEAASVTDHKGHLLGGGVFGREDEISFILAEDGVEDDDEFAISCVVRLVNYPLTSN